MKIIEDKGVGRTDGMKLARVELEENEFLQVVLPSTATFLFVVEYDSVLQTQLLTLQEGDCIILQEDKDGPVWHREWLIEGVCKKCGVELN